VQQKRLEEEQRASQQRIAAQKEKQAVRSQLKKVLFLSIFVIIQLCICSFTLISLSLHSRVSMRYLQFIRKDFGESEEARMQQQERERRERYGDIIAEVSNLLVYIRYFLSDFSSAIYAVKLQEESASAAAAASSSAAQVILL
jgi:hypothetical protein